VLKQRVITALIFAAIAVGLIVFAPPWLMACVIGLLVLAAGWEWSALSGLHSPGGRAIFLLALAAALGLAAWGLAPRGATGGQAGLWWFFGASCLAWLLAAVAVLGYPAGARLWGGCAARLAMGFAVLVPPWLAVVYLRSLPHGEYLVILGIALVAFVDIGGYFAGRAFGGPKLLPRVSPAKTWSGLAGGLAANLLLAAFAAWVAGLPAGRLAPWLLVALLTALCSVIGDLLESMVKRHSGIKDSGSLLPGHGGLFDRLDSLTAGLPVLAFGTMLGGGLGP